MKRTWLVSVLLAAFLLLALGGAIAQWENPAQTGQSTQMGQPAKMGKTAQSRQMGQHSRMGQNRAQYGMGLMQLKMMTDKLNLTADQQKELKGLIVNTRRDLINLKRDLDLKNLDLEVAMFNEDPDEATVTKLIQETGSIKTKMQVLQVNERMKFKKVLTPEQQKKMKEMHKNMFQKMKMRSGSAPAMQGGQQMPCPQCPKTQPAKPAAK